MFAEEFDCPGLDPAVRLLPYLPAWSSRAETAAGYEVRDSYLHLSITLARRRWMPAEDDGPLRVFGVQTATSPVRSAAPSANSRLPTPA